MNRSEKKFLISVLAVVVACMSLGLLHAGTQLHTTYNTDSGQIQYNYQVQNGSLNSQIQVTWDPSHGQYHYEYNYQNGVMHDQINLEGQTVDGSNWSNLDPFKLHLQVSDQHDAAFAPLNKDGSYQLDSQVVAPFLIGDPTPMSGGVFTMGSNIWLEVCMIGWIPAPFCGGSYASDPNIGTTMLY